MKNQKNKKVKNVQEVIYEGISFKSKLEANCYKLFKEAGIVLEYEKVGFTFFDSFNLKKGVRYDLFKSKRKTTFGFNNRVVDKLSYTPDFYTIYDGVHVFIETKGKANDAYPIKKRLLLYTLENNEAFGKYIFLEPHNIKQIEESINIIKTMTLVDKIYGNLKFISKSKDRKLAGKFIKDRKFIDLYDLVSACIQEEEIKLRNSKDKTSLIDNIGDLQNLKGLVYSYLEQLGETGEL